MLGDEGRTRAFLEALDRTVRPGMRVLDVGTGTGILAIRAARLGAEVVAVDHQRVIEFAREIAAANGVVVRFLRRNILEMADGEIAPVDVVVSEMIGHALLDERLVETLASARRFLRPGGRIIPRRVSFGAAPARSEELARADAFWRGAPYGVDLSPVADRARHAVFREADGGAEVLGPGARLREIDLSTAAPGPWSAEAALAANRAGEANAVLLWWEADLADGVALSTAPGRAWPGCHWRRALLPVGPRRVAAGEALPFRLSHDDGSPGAFSWSLAGDERSNRLAVPRWRTGEKAPA
jgi:protein arginine N-methyltransferase 1